MKNIAVIGCGVVGSAVARFYKNQGYVVTEIDPKLGTVDYNFVGPTQAAIVCVPTPTKETGQDLSMVKDVFDNLYRINYQGLVVLKSTVLPGTCDALLRKYELKLVHNPEFLTAKTPFEDFCAQEKVLLSGDHAVDVAWLLYKPFSFEVHCTKNYMETELAKYTHNCFLATKVAFFNQIYQIAHRLGVDYETVRLMVIDQGKVLANHTVVPGVDGFGYSGMCFPKDMAAFEAWITSMGLEDLAPLIYDVDVYNMHLRTL